MKSARAIAKAFMEVFGAGINLDPSAPDGMLVDLLAYMYTELAQAIQTVGANIDVSTATGNKAIFQNKVSPNRRHPYA